MPHAGRGDVAGGNSVTAASREREPGGVRTLPQRYHWAGEPMGAWREAPAGRVVEAVDAGRQERIGSRGMTMCISAISCHAKLDLENPSNGGGDYGFMPDKSLGRMAQAPDS